MERFFLLNIFLLLVGINFFLRNGFVFVQGASTTASSSSSISSSPLSLTTAAHFLSNRSMKVASFKVMDVLRRALELESQGKSIVHLEVGQPQSGAPHWVVNATKSIVENDRIGYTSALGILPLRQKICDHYQHKYNVTISPDQVVITTGSSAAFLLSFLSLFDNGESVAIASAGYPCYRNILNALGCNLVTIPINAQYKVTAKELHDYFEKGDNEKNFNSKNTKKALLKGLILSSPSNPTGSMLTREEIENLSKYCKEKKMWFISDEIYHGISYGKEEVSASEYMEGNDHIIVINSFSKYYSMTGWRLGWLILPSNPQIIDRVNRLAQNLYINAPTLSQLAACHVFDLEADDELKEHIQKYKENRFIILDALQSMGFDLEKDIAPSDGGFYIYVDTSRFLEDSEKFCYDALEECGVAMTPGTDFEEPEDAISNGSPSLGKKRLRLSYCGSTLDVKEGMLRLKEFWKRYPDRKVRSE